MNMIQMGKMVKVEKVETFMPKYIKIYIKYNINII